MSKAKTTIWIINILFFFVVLNEVVGAIKIYNKPSITMKDYLNTKGA